VEIKIVAFSPKMISLRSFAKICAYDAHDVLTNAQK